MLFVAAALVGLVVLWRQGALGDVGSAVRSADPFLVVAGFLLYLLGLALLSSRWHLLVILTHGRSDPARAAEAFLTSVVINYAAPIGLAVPARAALTKR
ncbi:MAG: lysylphosphatidylglycerol synthase domain-containing protein, partial [Chloroflexota bacterium]|nr:lysylphosphatidylglycerol synthase domain-containing protein [Chloroflexota bacterium]